MEEQLVMDLETVFGDADEDKDELCHVCNKSIPIDGTGVGVAWVDEGEIKHRSYHGTCYNAERLRERDRKSHRTSQHEAGEEDRRTEQRDPGPTHGCSDSA